LKLATIAAAVLLAQAVFVCGMARALSAELPTIKPKRAEAAKACEIGGMRGVVIPGSNACVKVGGYVSGGVEVGNLKH
jgi:hypothetical protein